MYRPNLTQQTLRDPYSRPRATAERDAQSPDVRECQSTVAMTGTRQRHHGASSTSQILTDLLAGRGRSRG
jgi:hypothetical protein